MDKKEQAKNINILRIQYHRFRNIILYGIFGCCSSGLDFLIYSIFVHFFCWNYIVSNSISVLAGITTSFCLNRAYNFKVKDHAVQRFAVFLTVGLSGMVLSNIILWVCIGYIGINKIIAKLLSIVLVVFFQFLVNKYVTFRSVK